MNENTTVIVDHGCALFGTYQASFFCKGEITVENIVAEISKRESGHDAGTYLEAAVYWNTDCPEAEQFAFFVESNIPARWDDVEQLDWKAKEAVSH